jgi:hypothetical protein
MIYSRVSPYDGSTKTLSSSSSNSYILSLISVCGCCAQPTASLHNCSSPQNVSLYISWFHVKKHFFSQTNHMVTPWNISYKIVFKMILVGVSSAILNKIICLAAWTCKTNVLWQPFAKYLVKCIKTICSIFDSNKVMTYSFWSPTNTIIIDIKSLFSIALLTPTSIILNTILYDIFQGVTIWRLNENIIFFFQFIYIVTDFSVRLLCTAYS